jgi:hypothetical protein
MCRVHSVSVAADRLTKLINYLTNYLTNKLFVSVNNLIKVNITKKSGTVL